MTSKRVLVVGGAGYVGSHLVKKMVEQDIPTRVLDTFWFGEHSLREIHPLEILKGDMRDLSVVREALTGVDTVIHLACISNDPSFELYDNMEEIKDKFKEYLKRCGLDVPSEINRI